MVGEGRYLRFVRCVVVGHARALGTAIGTMTRPRCGFVFVSIMLVCEIRLSFKYVKQSFIAYDERKHLPVHLFSLIDVLLRSIYSSEIRYPPR